MDTEAPIHQWHPGQRLAVVLVAVLLGGVLAGVADFIVPLSAARGAGIGFTVYAWNQLRPGWQQWLRRILLLLPLWLIAGALVGYGVHQVLLPLFR